ncbi:MAG: hypothetical protein E6X23_20550 [Mixta calida]|nr:hypothetical protein [Mixta calida]MDU4943894.1 hypothetical protein [Mixta calida]
MSKSLADHEAMHVRNFLEENWHEFVDHLAENYDDEAEGIAEEICKQLA